MITDFILSYSDVTIRCVSSICAKISRMSAASLWARRHEILNLFQAGYTHDTLDFTCGLREKGTASLSGISGQLRVFPSDGDDFELLFCLRGIFGASDSTRLERPGEEYDSTPASCGCRWPVFTLASDEDDAASGLDEGWNEKEKTLFKLDISLTLFACELHVSQCQSTFSSNKFS